MTTATKTRTAIVSTSVVKTLDLIRHPEDGTYYSPDVWYIHAVTADGRTMIHNSGQPKYLADELANAIHSEGTIDEQHWIDDTPSDWELPDYVTSPHRPEYN